MNIERQKERQLDLLRREVADLKNLVVRLSQQLPMAMATGLGAAGGSGGTRLAYASTGGLTARSGSTLGVGNADFVAVDGGGLVSTGVTSAVYSLCDEAISAGILLAVVNVNGVDVASPLECP
ncbi:hypothetical protein [Paludisphaera rhizosphaerae]|uniref:hypothetical protein n=1 Tax=Paludisphaera rhizosphaerae TaxID=2711216 RepID=UPI0013EAFE69|nr:hypothetical protein [Paludisphaera rhizosphaerae]